MTSLEATLADVRPLDEGSMGAARDRLDRLTKPPGSLGRLEEIVVWLAGVTGTPAPPVEPRRIVVAAADHGVAMRHAVSAWPSDVTAQMVATFVAGRAAISTLGAAARASIVVLDVGVATAIPNAGPTVPTAGSSGVARLVSNRIGPGTADMTAGPAMTRDQALAAIGVGLTAAADAVTDGVALLGLGDMGIGNTTSASAIVAALTGRPAAEVTGRGTGLNDAAWRRKIDAVNLALAVNRPDRDDPIGVLAAVGGFEIGAIVGTIAGAAANPLPVVLDGFITGAAALVACALQPAIGPRLVAGHRSVEPGHAITLDGLGLRPLLELDMRLGEGTGAALAMQLIGAAAAARDGMATFDEAAVSDRR
ncbi:MAG: nicotinate-nucleotide--dimethylbenzimidazole phosphoribosyltransferase [Chloroflexota bacterium]